MLEIKNITQLINAFDGLNSRLDKTEERNSELERMSIEIYQSEMQKEKKKKQTVHEPWDNYKQCSMCIIGIPEEVVEKGEDKSK